MSLRRAFAALAVAGLMAFSSLQASADDAVLLRRASKVGDKFSATIQSTQDMSQVRSDGASMKAKQSLLWEMGLEVLAVAADGTSEVKATYKRIAINVDDPTGKMEFDSANPAKSVPDNPALIDSKARLGKSLVMKVTPLGEVKEVKGGDEIVTAILAAIPDGRMRDMAKQQLAQTMNQDGLIQMMSVLTLRAPDQPKAVGQDWSWDQATNAGFATLNAKTTYVVDKINPDTAEISLRSVTQVVKTAEGFTVLIDPTTKTTGKVVVDRKDASVFTADMAQTMKLTVKTQNMTFFNEMNTTSRVTVKPEAAK